MGHYGVANEFEVSPSPDSHAVGAVLRRLDAAARFAGAVAAGSRGWPPRLPLLLLPRCPTEAPGNTDAPPPIRW